MSTLLAIWNLRLRGTLRKQRKGAAVLETVLLIVAAVVIVGAIIVAFVGRDAKGGILAQIKDGIINILKLNPLKNPSNPSNPG